MSLAFRLSTSGRARQNGEQRPIDELAARRAGRREANLRSLNERIADVQQDAGNADDCLHLVCECALASCDAGLVVPTGLFEEIRESDQRYLVAPGHVLQGVEHEVGQGDGWVMVEKFGAAAAAAMEARP